MNILNRTLSLAALAALATTWSACGGGGGGGSNLQAPAGLLYDGSHPILVVDLNSTANSPSVSGIVDHYSVFPSLPAGLTLDPATGVITGTPTETAPKRFYTITASNAAGSTTFALDLGVVGAPRFAYAAGAEDSSLLLFDVDPASGRLRRKGVQFAAAGERGPECICVHPSERFLYVPNALTNNISVYAINDADGWLLPRAPANAGVGPHAMALRPDGRFAYVANRGSGDLLKFGVDPATGELTKIGEPLPSGVEPVDIAIDPSGRFLFVTLAGEPVTGAGGGVQAYRIQPASGELTAAGPLVALDGSFPSRVRVGPLRNFLFVTLQQTDTVLPLRYDGTTGELTASTSNTTGSQPDAIAVDPLGRFAFVANLESASVSSYVVDSLSGELFASSTVATGARPAAVETDVAGRFLYVANRDSHDLMVFGVGELDGALSLVDTWMLRPKPVDFVVVRAPRIRGLNTRFLHVLNSGSADVSSFTVDAANGAPLETLPTSITGTEPVAIARHPRFGFVYAADRAGHALGEYRVDALSGALTQVSSPELVTGAAWAVAVEPSGRFLYLARRDVEFVDDAWLATYAINPLDGTLTLAHDQAIPTKPVALAVEPNGRFLYVAKHGTPHQIQSFAIDRETGIPTVSALPAPAPGVSTLAFHPNSRWLYGVLRASNTIMQYTIDPVNGQPVIIPTGSRAGLDPVGLCFGPDGRYAFAAYQDILDIEGGGHVAAFEVGPTGRLLTPALSYNDGMHPSALALDPAGRFLYVTNQSDNDLSVFALAPQGAALTVKPSVVTGLAPVAIVVTPD